MKAARPHARFPASLPGAGSNLMAVLGPVRCQGCQRLVWWGRSREGGFTWRDILGAVHRCRGRAVENPAADNPVGGQTG